ncbi:MAG: hypothetical protein M1818_002680 [Claussenomyces sp. TS43310]|nr:MAG: hypothetical protein M1818_002680 [Claussenomyces sp. TS43310]
MLLQASHPPLHELSIQRSWDLFRGSSGSATAGQIFGYTETENANSYDENDAEYDYDAGFVAGPAPSLQGDFACLELKLGDGCHSED